LRCVQNCTYCVLILKYTLNWYTFKNVNIKEN
jgi:hypothetical protein